MAKPSTPSQGPPGGPPPVDKEIPAYWSVIESRFRGYLKTVTAPKAPLTDALNLIMGGIKMKFPVAQHKVKKLEIDIPDGEDGLAIALLLIAILFVDLCHDSNVRNIRRHLGQKPYVPEVINKKKTVTQQADRSLKGTELFELYIEQVNYMYEGIQTDLLNLIRNYNKGINLEKIPAIARNTLGAINTCVNPNDVTLKGGTDEHDFYCLIFKNVCSIFKNNVNVAPLMWEGPVGDIKNPPGPSEGAFDQALGHLLAAQAKLNIKPVLSVAAVADRGLPIQNNPTLNSASGVIFNTFSLLVCLNKAGQHIPGPTFWNLVMKSRDTDGGAESPPPSFPTTQKDSDDSTIWEFIDQTKYTKTLDALETLYKYIDPDVWSTFQASEEDSTAQDLFKKAIAGMGRLDPNDTWDTVISLSTETYKKATLLNVNYEYMGRNTDDVEITVANPNSKDAAVQATKGFSLSAADTRFPTAKTKGININDTLRKTVTDMMMVMYAYANDMWHLTGDKVAGVVQVVYAILISIGKVTTKPNYLKPKFVFETAKPAMDNVLIYDDQTVTVVEPNTGGGDSGMGSAPSDEAAKNTWAPFGANSQITFGKESRFIYCIGKGMVPTDRVLTKFNFKQAQKTSQASPSKVLSKDTGGQAGGSSGKTETPQGQLIRGTQTQASVAKRKRLNLDEQE